jgi:AcrR family transcriptional regulator
MTAAATSRRRILDTARPHLLRSGYSALTMDDLAGEVGMSKKTLYQHFPSKDALVGEVIDELAADMRSAAEALFSDQEMEFTEKLHRFIEGMTRRFVGISPHILRDLQRFAPQLYHRVEELRQKNIPVIFGQLVRQGRAAGMVRDDIDPVFAVNFWRAAVQSLMHPDSLERLELRPDQVFQQGISLFFGGLLTPAGYKAYEKKFSR